MKVKIKKLNDKAVVPFKKYDSDFCYDVVATSCKEIAPYVYRYGIGLAFEIDDYDVRGDEVVLDIDLRPRSSIWETGMVLSNCEGTVDFGYRNEVSAVFYHVMQNMPRYQVGDKIGQIKIGVTAPIEFEVVDELSKSDRGLNGYGSTGRKA